MNLQVHHYSCKQRQRKQGAGDGLTRDGRVRLVAEFGKNVLHFDILTV